MNTTTNIPAGVNTYFETDLLMRAVANFEFVRYATLSKDIPKGKGLNIKWRRHGNLVAATTPLTEGVTPAGSSATVTDITAIVKEYGDYLEFTDIVEYTSDDPDLNDFNQVQADQAADTLDVLTRTEIFGGSTVQYAGTATSRVTIDSTMKLNAAEARECVRTLKNNNAKYLKELIKAEVGYGTSSIPKAFIGFIHPNGSYDIKTDGSFIPVYKYSRPDMALPNEIGTLDDIRFIETTQCPVYAGAGSAGIDVYATLVIAKGAYGVARLAGESMKNIMKPLGSAGTDDPLDQRSTKAWKAFFAAKRLNDAFMVRIEHAVTA
jgi:N4-gp56 family major capsid protein